MMFSSTDATVASEHLDATVEEGLLDPANLSASKHSGGGSDVESHAGINPAD
jgi:hypothetical protein